MTYDDDNERIERVMFGVPYKATAAEARRVWGEVVEQPAWHDFNHCDDLLKSPGAVILGVPDIWAIARSAASSYRQCVRNAIKAIETMEAERG